MLLTTGSRRAQARERRSFKFWLGGSRKNIEVQEQILSRVAFQNILCFTNRKEPAECTIVQNVRRRATSEDAQVKSRPRGVTG